MMFSVGVLALRGVRSAGHHRPRTALYGTGLRGQSVRLSESHVAATAAAPSVARPCVVAHRCMHTSCRSLSGVAGQGRSRAATGNLLSQWSRRGGEASTRTPRLLSADEDRPTDGRAPPLQPDSNASAAPPSIEELLAEVDEDDTGTSSAAPAFLTETRREVLREDWGGDAVLLPWTESTVLRSSASSEKAGLSGTSNAAHSSGRSASSGVEATLLEALLQQPFSDDPRDGVDRAAEDDADEPEEEAPRATGTDPITNASFVLTHEQYHSPESWRTAEEGAADDADTDGEAEAEPVDDAVDEEESMESVLEEEADRLFCAALTNTSKAQETAAQDGVWRDLFGDYTLFSKETVPSAVGSLPATDSAAAADATPALSRSERSIDAPSMPAVEFDDEAAREAEMESVGDVMATSVPAATAAAEGRKR